MTVSFVSDDIVGVGFLILMLTQVSWPPKRAERAYYATLITIVIATTGAAIYYY